jgi:HAMP domain-containing protein
MPDVTLTELVDGLRQALAGTSALLGEPGEDGTGGSGLAGAAAVARNSPTASVDGVATRLGGQLDGVLQVDTGQLTAAGGALLELQARAQVPPADALAGFTGKLTGATGALAGDAIAPMRQTLEAVTGISGAMPADRGAIVSILIDQIVRVLASLDSEEAKTIGAWVSSVEEQSRVLLPLIAEVQAGGDPGAVAVAVVERSLGSVLDLVGAGDLGRLLDALDLLLADPLDTAALPAVTASLELALTGYAGVVAALDADVPTFRAAVVTTVDALQTVKLRLRPVMRTLHRIASARILAPGELEAYLRATMDEALGVPVRETQQIDDPFHALLDRIDAAIEGIDLESVRTQILGFFAEIRSLIERADIGSIGDALTERLGSVESAVVEVQQGLDDLQTEIAAFFTQAAGQIRSGFEPLGQFLPNGTFRYAFESDLRAALTRARAVVAGDPVDPDAFSLAGALQEVQDTVDGLTGRLQELLEPVEEAIEGAVDEAVQGVEAFSAALDDLDVPGTIGEVEAELQGVMDSMGDLEFGTVVDAVVGALDDVTVKVRGIDPESINPTIRAALGAALGLVIDFDFTGLVRAPLRDAVSSVSRQAVEALQARVDDLLAAIDQLAPRQLLAELFDAADVVSGAVGSLDVGDLIAPLDELHDRYLQQPLQQLRPSELLEPVTDAFSAAQGAFAAVGGATILASLTTRLDELKALAHGVDVGGRIDEIAAAVDTVLDDLASVRPSALLAPLLTELGRLDAELDRLKPSVVFAPVAALTTPLLSLLENVQQAVVQALFDLFKAPLALLDRLEPEVLATQVRQRTQVLIDAVAAVDLQGRIGQLGERHLAITAAVGAGGVKAKVDLAVALDPRRQLGELLEAHNDLVAALVTVRDGTTLPDLAGLYSELRDHLIGMLPPYARELLDVDTFKRVMRLADPTRFLTELDQRFDTIKQKLLPISPDELAAELDADWQALVDQLDGLDVRALLAQVKTVFTRIEGILDDISLDQVADGIDEAVAPVRAVVGALDPSRFLVDLDALHADVAAVVAATKPSEVLAGLQAVLDRLTGIVAKVNMRTTLGPPLDQAWAAVTAQLAVLDVGVLLAPLVDKLAELELGLEAGLDRIEGAFDDLLRAVQQVMGGGGSAEVGASASVGVGGGG